jgi:NAD(P)-dependent dehydrogenase (short-subunit alcohol dehydrogenase family)
MQKLKKHLLVVLVSAPLAMAGQQASAADIKERSIRVSHVVPKDHPFQVGVSKFAELKAENWGGKIKVRGYPDGQRGAELQSIAAAQGGVIEMALVSTAATASTVKEFGVHDLPFLFSTHKEADLVLDGPVGRKLFDKLPERSLVGLRYFEDGFRHVTNSSKGAVNLLSKSMAVELGPDNIRVNAICPVLGETGLLESFMGVPDTPENRKKFIATIPLGRLSRPSDIAAVAMFLASNAAELVTGVEFPVDGGRTI